MDPILIVGIIVLTGFLVGELCSRLRLPKVTGYILAGVLLNPRLTGLVPLSFVDHTAFVTNLSLAFITFSVGGTLFFPKVKRLGKAIIWITTLESELAFLAVAVVFILLGPVIAPNAGSGKFAFFLPFAFFMAALASPTDPSATLAIEHEYHAKGEVSATVMGVAAFDDIFGILNYSVALAAAGFLIRHVPLSWRSLAQPCYGIAGAVLLGIVFGGLLNGLTKKVAKQTEGVMITLIVSLLALCYGLAKLGGMDELLSTMTMGIVVVNFNIKQDQIFKMLERYTEELIFVLFFTISAMHLDFSVLAANAPLILLFVIFRAAGKIGGAFIGGALSHASRKVRRYTAGGLIPQGGIVIGLALVIKQNPAFAALSDVLINVVIGATIIHELIGPLLARRSLEAAGEIDLGRKTE